MGLHVGNMPNFYMMIGPQSLNPVTNVTLLCEEQAKHIAGLALNAPPLHEVELKPQSATGPNVARSAPMARSVALQQDMKALKPINNKLVASAVRVCGESRGLSEHLLGAEGGGAERLLTFSKPTPDRVGRFLFTQRATPFNR